MIDPDPWLECLHYGWNRGLRTEGRAVGIRVTTMIPGGMQTHFFDRFVEQNRITSERGFLPMMQQRRAFWLNA